MAKTSGCHPGGEALTLEAAKACGADCFTTTLSISPLKNAEVLNRIGEKLGEELGVNYLCTDFKKREGYKRSIELSKQYDLYRQNYCGCVFSEREAQERACSAWRKRKSRKNSVSLRADGGPCGFYRAKGKPEKSFEKRHGDKAD